MTQEMRDVVLVCDLSVIQIDTALNKTNYNIYIKSPFKIEAYLERQVDKNYIQQI